MTRIRACATPTGRAIEGACSLEGTRLFERALRAGATLQAAVTTEAFLADPAERVQSLLTELRATNVPLAVVPDPVMTELTDGRGIGALVGLAALPTSSTLESLVQAEGRATFLGIVGVDDPGNVGALVRTALGLGARALLTIGACDAFHPKAVRTSMGSIFRLPIISAPTLDEIVTDLRALNIETVGSISSQGVPLPKFEPSATGSALFMGSEAFGLSPADQSLLDHLVTIPMSSAVDSLSVNAAAAILTHHLAHDPVQ